MKKVNFKLIGTCALLFSLIFPQVILAEIIIRKDNPDPGDVSTQSVKRLPSYSMNSVFVSPVTADIFETELGVFFSQPVGTAVIKVSDAFGSVIYQTIVDTNVTPDVYIPLDGFDSGSYVLRISYGTTNLIGEFEL
jgi:hypothetical protein